MKKYQVGYRDNGIVKYCPLTHEEGIKYNSLSSDDERLNFIQDKITSIKIQGAINRW